MRREMQSCKYKVIRDSRRNAVM